MRSSLIALAMAVSSVMAQAAQNYTSSLDMEINPGTIDPQDRASWCTAQTNTCNQLCDNDTNKNSCAQSTLDWECTCASNNSAPGLQYYTQTVPTFICQSLFSQCITTNAGSQDGQDSCKENIEELCATQSPPVASSDDEDEDDSDDSASTGTESATVSATQSESDSTATADSVTSTSSDAFAAPTMAPAGKGAAAAVAIGMLAYLV
ncbi:hypothetical protein ACJ41O_002796 [Fusarium nematophilum]